MKRKADDDPSSDNQVQVKTEKDSPSIDYSQDVKKKISTSARTGQACDRCRVRAFNFRYTIEILQLIISSQVRKMRCDDQPNGCASCLQNRSECKTTDRISGIATVRGYVQCLERQLDELQHRNHELEARLVSLGHEVKPRTDYQDNMTIPLQQWHKGQASGSGQEWQGDSLVPDKPVRGSNNYNGNPGKEQPPSIGGVRLPDFRGGLAGNNYLGVSTGNSLLSSIRGTSMSVLGMEIDLADYMSPDVDEPDPSIASNQPIYNKSYRAFVQTAFGTSPKLRQVELPPRSEGMTYADVYFRAVSPYVPIVHKPSFMAIVS